MFAGYGFKQIKFVVVFQFFRVTSSFNKNYDDKDRWQEKKNVG